MKLYVKTVAIAAIALSAQQVTAQTVRGVDTTRKYFNRLLSSKDEADKALLETKLYNLLKSDKEKDWTMANNFFYQLKKINTSDSITKAVKVKFPLGAMARSEAVDTVYKAKTAAEKETLYKAWIKKFPPEELTKDAQGDERVPYDYVRSAIGHAYADEDNVTKAVEYANAMESPFWRSEGWAGIAGRLQKKGHDKEALALLLKARENSRLYRTTKTQDVGAGFAAMGYTSYSSSVAEIYYKQKKYKEALAYIKDASDSSKEIRANVFANYVNILMALNRNQEAFDKIETAIKAGQATEPMKDQLKAIYPKVKNSGEPVDVYLANINKQLAEKFMRELPKTMIDLPAPGFTLKDFEGNTVSLESLKGKTVVVDFWATWCGPCKASFPAMQMAVNKYKSDPNVKFLFIHTWERGTETPTEDAKKYINEMKYDFTVLMDLKDSETGINKAIDGFKVSGIPTKFIIDKNGHIRFRMTGFSGGNDAAVEELSAMIKLASQS